MSNFIGKSDNRPNILIVDDYRENLLAAETLLAGMDVNIVKATSGVEALRHLLDQEFALIMLDVDMPVMNGFETAEIIKKREKLKHIPIVFFTMTGRSEEQMYKGYAAGAVDYILKPFPKDVLRAKVGIYLDLYYKTRDLLRSEKQLDHLNRLLEQQIVEKTSELWKAEEKYRNIFENAVEGVFQVSPDGKFVTANPAMAHILRYDSPLRLMADITDIGQQIVVDSSRGHEFLRCIREYGQVLGFEGEIYRRDGNRIWVMVNVYAVKNEDNQLVFYEGTITDITERKRAEGDLRKLNEKLEQRVLERTAQLESANRELEQANLKLQEIDRLKSMFIASMSHELRTPLNSVIGFSSVLLNQWIGPLNDEQKKVLSIISRSGKHLLALISDVIDVSKVEAGAIDVYAQDFDLDEVITESVNLLSREINDRKLELKVESIHQTMHTDRKRLQQCVLNLLSNAVKFTEKGSIDVHVCQVSEFKMKNGEKYSPLIAPHPAVEISVADTGIGIKEEDIPRLFKSFVRINSPLSSMIPGTGLGLYLTRNLVMEVLKGDISAESKYGEGSKFTIRIPVRI